MEITVSQSFLEFQTLQIYTAVSSGVVSKAVVSSHSNTSAVTHLKNPLGCWSTLFLIRMRIDKDFFTSEAGSEMSPRAAVRF